MDAAEADGQGVRAELVDCLGETLGVESSGFAVGAGLVDTMATVGDDQGDEGARPGHHPEGELHQVEERFRVELGGAVDLLEVEQLHQAVEDGARGQNRSDEGDGQGLADPPQAQLPVVFG
ncbi:hypothetical protein [Streptomyces sp. NBC_00015]|uniref:hypothetical protein n=1 Tax=Streptomyces sp. NBC_00015 TaxID=2903611 RepID=UPI0038704023